jgi:hypothetical protein
LLLVPALSALAADSAPAASESKGFRPIRIKPKGEAKAASSGDLLAPDTDNIDTPTTAVLDYGGYATRTRFYANGGMLEYVNFGIFQNLNLGASLTIDGIIGNDRTVRVRAPQVQVKYRFYEGDRYVPSFAAGYDGQGWDYASTEHRYNHRQRGFFVVASEELGVPGLLVHPQFNISDFDSNSFFGSIPLSYNILDKVEPMVEWDNINNFHESRFNAGARFNVTPHFNLDFAVRGIGQGGDFPNGDSRGPERIVQLRYSGNF